MRQNPFRHGQRSWQKRRASQLYCSGLTPPLLLVGLLFAGATDHRLCRIGGVSSFRGTTEVCRRQGVQGKPGSVRSGERGRG